VRMIDDKTAIPIGIAVTIIGGAAVWLTTMHINQTALAKSLDEKEPVLHQMASDIQDIKIQLAQIQFQLRRK